VWNVFNAPPLSYIIMRFMKRRKGEAIKKGDYPLWLPRIFTIPAKISKRLVNLNGYQVHIPTMVTEDECPIWLLKMVTMVGYPKWLQ
jgi:hypothetical protein